MDGVNEYIKEVLSGKIVVGESEISMVQRHLSDLEMITIIEIQSGGGCM